MKKIWKFPLRHEWFHNSGDEIQMPAGSKILTAQTQENVKIVLWALCDPNAALVTRKFVIMMTGVLIEAHDRMTFIATVQCGPFVGHVFELTD